MYVRKKFNFEHLNLPHLFISNIQSALKQDAEIFFNALLQEPAVSIRHNPFKPANVLLPNAKQIEWCELGYHLQERPAFTADPLFHTGAYYVQESSSMFLHHVFLYIKKQMSGAIKVLDVCAAPGGKSTLLASLLSENDVLVSNEIIKSRVLTLVDNMSKWGCINTFVSNNDPKDFATLSNQFDVIVIDAPCSGEGLFRKDKQAIEEWSEGNVELCAARQKRIIADVLPALKPNGFLIYSTCTFNEKENEENVKRMKETCGLETVQIPVKTDWLIEQTNDNGFRFWFHKTKGEGLFTCCLQKKNETTDVVSLKNKNNLTPVSAKQRQVFDEYLSAPTNFEIYQQGYCFNAVLKIHSAFYEILNSVLHLVKAGIKMGGVKQNVLIPEHDLALSLAVNTNILRTELTQEQALIYLKKGNLAVDTFTQKGWQLVTFKNLPLGWVKVLPNRVNNYLPKALRVLKDF